MILIKASYCGDDFTFLVLEDKLWILVHPVTSYLEFRLPTYRLLLRHCLESQYKPIKTYAGQGCDPIYISLAGFIRLINRSSHVLAYNLQDWVLDEVLPKILINRVYVDVGSIPYQQEKWIDTNDFHYFPSYQPMIENNVF